MTIYEAIMKAADHIEANPNLFDFGNVTTPYDDNGSACAIGRILQYRGFGHRMYVGLLVPAFLGITEQEFFDRIGAINEQLGGLGPNTWKVLPCECAASLRLYADKYHAPARVFTGLPDSIRQIFEVETA